MTIVEGTGPGRPGEGAVNGDDVVTVRTSAETRQANAMAAALHHFVTAPDTATAVGQMRAEPGIRVPAALALLDQRARQAGADGRHELAQHLRGRIELLAGVADPARLDVLIDLGRAERELVASISTQRPPSDEIERARQAVTSVMASAPDAYPRALWLPVWDAAARVAGRLADLNHNSVWMEVAVSATRRAVEASPPQSLGLARQMSNLSVRLGHLHAATGDETHLAEAVAMAERSAELTPADSSELPGRLGNLANRLSEQFHADGDRALLDRAVSVARQAVSSAGNRAPELPVLLDNLSAHLLESFQAGGPQARLDESAAIARRTLALTSQDSLALAERLDALALRLILLAVSRGDSRFLAEAVSSSRRAVEPESPAWRHWVTLALALSRFALAATDQAQPRYAAEAAGATTTAIQLAGLGDSDGPPVRLVDGEEQGERLAAVADGLDQLGTQLRDPSLSIAALAAARAGLRLSRPSDDRWPLLVSTLAHILGQRYQVMADRRDLDEAISLWRQLAQRSDTGRSSWTAHDELARHLGDLHAIDSDPSVLAEAIAHARAGLDLVADDRARRGLLRQLSVLLARRFWLGRDLGVLTEAVVAAHAAADGASAHDPELPHHLHNLAARLLEHHNVEPDLTTLREAVEAGRGAVETLPADSPHRADYLNDLANALARLHGASPDPAVLADAVDVARRSVEASADQASELGGRLAKLAARLTELHRATGEVEALVEAVGASRRAVTVTPPDGSDLDRRLSNLADRLTELMALDPSPELASESITVARRRLDLAPADGPDRLDRLVALAARLVEGYEATASAEVLGDAIEVAGQAEGAGSAHPGLRVVMARLEGALSGLATGSEEQRLRHHAVESARQVAEATAGHDPQLSYRLNLLATRLAEFYAVTGDRPVLTEAVDVARRAVAVAHDDDPDRPSYLNNLAIRLARLHAVSGDPDVLDESVDAARQAVATTPVGSPDLAGYLNNLANRLVRLYAAGGDRAVLAQAVDTARHSVQATPVDSPELPSRLNNLANHLARLHTLSGDRAALDEAVSTARRAVEATPAGGTELPSRLNNLSNHLSRLVAETDDSSILAEAARTSRAVLEAVPDGHPDRPRHLGGVAARLAGLAAVSGDLSLLAEAVERASEAVEAIPPRGPELPGYLMDLARYEVELHQAGWWDKPGQPAEDSVEGLRDAVTVARRAVDVTPATSADLADRCRELAGFLAQLHLADGSLALLVEAVDVGRRALNTASSDLGHEIGAFLSELADHLALLHGATGDVGALEEAVTLTQRAVTLTPSSHPDHGQYRDALLRYQDLRRSTG